MPYKYCKNLLGGRVFHGMACGGGGTGGEAFSFAGMLYKGEPYTCTPFFQSPAAYSDGKGCAGISAGKGYQKL